MPRLQRHWSRSPHRARWVSCRFDTVDAVRKLAPYLRMVHLDGVQASGGKVNVLPGKGIARIRDVMRELKRVN